MMQAAIRTQFSTFPEPELLGPLPTATALHTSAADDTDALIARIDKELQAGNSWWQLSAKLHAWTHTALTSAHAPTWEPVGTVTTIYVPNWEAVGAPFRVFWSSGRIDVDQPAITPTPATHLDSSLAEIQSWLGIGLDAASRAAGISRGTVYAWRQRGSSPRPGTVAAIMRIHGLVASAVKAVGVEQAREWFHTGSPSPVAEMTEAKGDSARLRALSTRLRRELFRVPVPPPNPLLAATADDVIR
jgi:hypothetical protein